MPAGRPKGSGLGKGGRPKGVLNKRTVEVEQRLLELGCDPILGMAKIATNPKVAIELRAKMYAELAAYVYPKRKAVEHSGAIELPVRLVMRSVLDEGKPE